MILSLMVIVVISNPVEDQVADDDRTFGVNRCPNGCQWVTTFRKTCSNFASKSALSLQVLKKQDKIIYIFYYDSFVHGRRQLHQPLRSLQYLQCSERPIRQHVGGPLWQILHPILIYVWYQLLWCGFKDIVHIILNSTTESARARSSDNGCFSSLYFQLVLWWATFRIPCCNTIELIHW